MADRKELLNRIVKMFKLGDANRNTNENEVLLAVTKARELMAKHNVSQAELNSVVDQESAKKLEFIIKEYGAYTRKGTSFASYDAYVAAAVDKICGTRNIVRSKWRWVGTKKVDHTVSRVFVGEEADAALAGELFLILLERLRRGARQRYGSGKWTHKHTSYGDGFGSALLSKAEEELNLSAADVKSTALVVWSKDQAINKFLRENNVRDAEPQRLKERDFGALVMGMADGRQVNLAAKKAVR